MAIEIVSCPMKNGDFPISFLYVYQGVRCALPQSTFWMEPARLFKVGTARWEPLASCTKCSKTSHPILPLLVDGRPTPVKNMSSSVGMIIPNIWKHNPNVPNHQPALILNTSLETMVFRWDFPQNWGIPERTHNWVPKGVFLKWMREGMNHILL